MPFGLPHHRNRSKQVLAVNDQPAQEGAAQSQNNSGSASPRASQIYSSNASGDESRNSQQPQTFSQSSRQDPGHSFPPQNLIQDTDRRQYPGAENPPARSQSTRYSVGSAYHQQQQLQLLQQQASSSADNIVYDSRNEPRNDSRIEVRNDQPPPASSSERSSSKKSASGFLRSFRSKESKSTPPQAQHNASGLGRKLSRRTEQPPSIRTSQSPANAEQQRFEYQAAQGSRTQLAPQHEDIEDDVDPYQIRPGQEDIHTAPPSAISEYNQHHSIRSVQNDSDQSDYDENRQVPIPPPHAQHPHDIHHQHSDSSSSNYQYQPQQHTGHPQHTLHPGSVIAGDPYRQQNAETVSQISYESPTGDQREEQQRLYHTNGHSPTSIPVSQQEFVERSNNQQAPRPSSQSNSGNMPQTGASQQQSRRESRQPHQGSQGPGDNRDGRDSRESLPPNYSRQGFNSGQSQQSQGVGQNNPPTNNSNYRGGPPQRESSLVAGGGDQGRSTPPPVAPGERTVEDNYKDLLVKYKKVKGLYFDKTAQVEQLQNTLAIQRLSQSRTSLDDSEYMNRFERLDRAIVNLAFNIRKDWRTIPSWLLPSCNQEAVKTGKQEMTGVGRACITRFLVDEIFNKTFHPALDPQLSHNLKAIERNIRRNAAPTNNQEESEGLTTKIVNWRLATLEGLREQLSSPQADEHKDDFLRVSTTKLCASLIQHLQEAPPGLEDVVRTVIDLAVSISSNMPLESRDIVITHPMPGDLVMPSIMKVETGIPPLENPCENPSEESSSGSGEKEEKEVEKSSSEGGKLRKKDKQGSGKKAEAAAVATETKGKLAAGEERVRFAGFVAVEVRGRQMLMKAPVWTMTA